MASDTKWTPGPWSRGGGTYKGWWSYTENSNYRIEQTALQLIIARTFGGFGDVMEKANANLIASAPDLYEALAGLLTGHPSGDNEAQKIGRAALAKARGES